MRKSINKKLLLSKLAVIILFMAIIVFSYSPSYAIPSIQLYINSDDVTYIEKGHPDPWLEESWFTTSSAFELWVIICKHDFDDVNLVIAALQSESGSVTLDLMTTDISTGYTYPYTYSASDFVDGTPIIGYKKKGDPIYMPPHGVYDTPYVTHNLGAISIDDDDVYNMVAPEEPAPGKIIKFNVTNSGFSRLHFDAYGDGEFAPFSHDAQAGVPEPASMILFGIGMLGFGAIKRKRRKE